MTERDAQDQMAQVGGIAGERLRSFIERLERLIEEKDALLADIREVKSEAKGVGFDVPAINHILKLRKSDPAALREFEDIVDVYKRALDME
jgi:uncharacterized protein (UPF0335 family)